MVDHRYSNIITCDECNHLFDEKDQRSSKVGGDNYCPICTLFDQRRADWAITNDCNGIFETFSMKSAAEEEIKKGDYLVAGCEIVPAIVVPIPKWSQPYFSAFHEEHERQKG